MKSIAETYVKEANTWMRFKPYTYKEYSNLLAHKNNKPIKAGDEIIDQNGHPLGIVFIDDETYLDNRLLSSHVIVNVRRKDGVNIRDLNALSKAIFAVR